MSTTEQRTEQQLLIGGAWRAAEGGRTFSPVGGWRREPTGAVAAASVADAQAAADAAGDAFASWSATPPAERRRILLKAADLLEERTERIAAIMIAETGSTTGWGAFNVHLAAGIMREAAAEAYGLVGEVLPSDVPGLYATAERRPVGVVLGIAPWNAPMILGTRAVAVPLAYGNTVVLKASEASSRTHAEIVRALVDAGTPDGVVNLVTNAPEDAPQVVDALIAHPAVARINFTGSTPVGRIIAATAARYLKRTLLELGGKAPFVVLPDADLEAAADAASFGAFMNSGQICMSTERVVVDSAIAHAFAAKLAERAGALVVGDPEDEATQIAALINDGAVEKVQALVDDAVDQGAELLTGGRPEGGGFLPTVLFGVTPAMRVYGEESFGPIASIVVAQDTDDAVRIANDTDLGLSSAVFGGDVIAARKVARRLRTGICHVNGPTLHDEPHMPFGGVGASGWGRFGGTAARDEFSEVRWLTVSEEERHYPI
jgi:benzaldehyde dehydrogenase (NAD)